MRRAAIAVAVMVAFVAVAPSVGAQCDPQCVEVMDPPSFDKDPGDDVLTSDPGIPDTGDAGAVLP